MTTENARIGRRLGPANTIAAVGLFPSPAEGELLVVELGTRSQVRSEAWVSPGIERGAMLGDEIGRFDRHKSRLDR